MIDLPEQIEAVRREIKLRKSVYSRRVANKQMTAEFAALEIARMEAVLATVQAADDAERLLL